MKYSILILIGLFLFLNSTAQKVIHMEKEGGVYKVPCVVNGVKMKFIFDTGAATVCISKTMAEFLFENDYLKKEDILGKGSSSVADGRIVDHIIINLCDIVIGGMHLRNVKAVVIQGQNTPLLLGQTAIQELGRISIDGDRLIIQSLDNNLSEEEINSLVTQALQYIDSRDFAAAIECFLKIDDSRGLSANGLRELAYCYSQNDQYNECIGICKRWIRDFESSSDEQEKSFVYGYLSGSYYFGLKDFNQAMLWFQKSIPLTEKVYGKQSTTYNKYLLANCYMKLERYYEAKTMFQRAINDMFEVLGVTINDIQVKGVENEQLGFMFYDYAYCCYLLDEKTKGDGLLILSAKCGYKYGIQDCEKNSLNYK